MRAADGMLAAGAGPLLCEAWLSLLPWSQGRLGLPSLAAPSFAYLLTAPSLVLLVLLCSAWAGGVFRSVPISYCPGHIAPSNPFSLGEGRGQCEQKGISRKVPDHRRKQPSFKVPTLQGCQGWQRDRASLCLFLAHEHRVACAA